MNRSFSRVASLCSRHRAPDTSWRGARVEPAPRAWAGWVRGTGPSLCDAGRSAVPAPPWRGSPELCTEPGLGYRGPGAEGGWTRVQPMLCAQRAAWPETWKPWQRLGFQARGASLGITEPGRENPARSWGLASGEEARGSPSPPATCRAGGSLCWVRLRVGPVSLRTTGVFHSEVTKFLVTAFHGAFGNLGLFCLIRNRFQGGGG